MKTILIYCWDSVCEFMAIRAMKEWGFQVITFSERMNDYHADAIFAQKCITCLHEQKVDVVFSYDYFPLLSMICQMNGILYASWIYDCPQYTLLSQTITNDCNHIFCFDRVYAQRLQELGAKWVYHFPLAADVRLYKDAKKAETGKIAEETSYISDISFVGSLYNDENNRFLSAEWTEYTAGYLEALISAQSKVYGYNLIADSLTEKIATEVVDQCSLSLGKGYIFDPYRMAADVINHEITSRDRQDALGILAEYFEVTLYSNSRLPQRLQRKPHLHYRGTVDYRTQMPLIFHNSKINLNISSRTIESGIPQRVFDILACGGFCLTNYQPEIAELFEDGRDLVMYTSFEDMWEKAKYYLAHEKERTQIARAGYEKVKAFFTIEVRIKELLEMNM